MATLVPFVSSVDETPIICARRRGISSSLDTNGSTDSEMNGLANPEINGLGPPEMAVF